MALNGSHRNWARFINWCNFSQCRVNSFADYLKSFSFFIGKPNAADCFCLCKFSAPLNHWKMCSARFYFYTLGARTWRKWNRAREWCGGGGKIGKKINQRTQRCSSSCRKDCKKPPLTKPAHASIHEFSSLFFLAWMRLRGFRQQDHMGCCFHNDERKWSLPRFLEENHLFRASNFVLRNCLYKVFTPKINDAWTAALSSLLTWIFCFPRRTQSNR